jgi:hypothetical protein
MRLSKNEVSATQKATGNPSNHKPGATLLLGALVQPLAGQAQVLLALVAARQQGC